MFKFRTKIYFLPLVATLAFLGILAINWMFGMRNLDLVQSFGKESSKVVYNLETGFIGNRTLIHGKFKVFTRFFCFQPVKF